MLIGLLLRVDMHFYKHNIGELAAATRGLDFEEIGIFYSLLDRFVLTEKPIKTQWVNLGFKGAANEKAIAILDALFLEVDGGYVYEPALKWIEEYQANAEKNRENGKKGGRPRKSVEEKPIGLISVSNENPMERQTLNTNHKTVIKEKIEKKKTDLVKPVDVDDETFDEWLTFKKQVSKAKTSQRMVDAMIREAGKAGISTKQAMITQIENGWQGFKAEYVNKRNGNASFAFDPATVDYSKGLIDNGDGTYSF